MWTVSITKVEADIDGVAKVTYEYTDGNKVESVVERISDPDSYKRIGQYGIIERERKDAIANLISNPPIGQIDFSAPEPTQEELDKRALYQKRAELKQLKEDVELGLATQSDLDTAISEAQTLKANGVQLL